MKNFLISLMAGTWSPIVAAIVASNIGFVFFIMFLVNDHPIIGVAVMAATIALIGWLAHKIHVWCFYYQEEQKNQ